MGCLVPFLFVFNDPAPTEIYTLSLHDALPISCRGHQGWMDRVEPSCKHRRSTEKLARRCGGRSPDPLAAGRPRCAPSNRSEEHTSELQSHSDLVCRLLLEKKKKNRMTHKRRES